MKNNFILDKVYHEFQQGGGFFQGAVWVWQITRVLQTCIARRSKVQMVKTQTNSLNNQWQIWVSFSFEVHRGMAGIFHVAL
jgi:hypothetical protein